MKKNYFFYLFFCCTVFVNAQTTLWSSNSDDYASWSILDGDGDGFNWGVYDGLETYGFSGYCFLSQSYDWTNAVALTPENYLFSPTIAIPSDAAVITFKMKAGSPETTYYAEQYAVLVYDVDDTESDATPIFVDTLTEGGENTAKTISAEIPASFASKNIQFVVLHFDTTDEYALIVDDFEITYSTSLSVSENTLSIAKIFPNPVNDVVTIDTNETIEAASVYSPTGKSIIEIQPNAISNNKIDLSNLESGLYFMTVKSLTKSATVKIIKN